MKYFWLREYFLLYPKQSKGKYLIAAMSASYAYFHKLQMNISWRFKA